MTIDQVVGQLKRQRGSLGLSIAEVARGIGISRPGLSRLEAGVDNPSNETLTRWANYFGFSVVWSSETGWRIEKKDTGDSK